LPMHSLGARQRVERFRPHPIARKICPHLVTAKASAGFKSGASNNP
jgi:hypothetical protein